jgi:hypothetical protein
MLIIKGRGRRGNLGFPAFQENLKKTKTHKKISKYIL